MGRADRRLRETGLWKNIRAYIGPGFEPKSIALEDAFQELRIEALQLGTYEDG